MASKIALIGAGLSGNLGGPSLLVSTRLALSNVFPDGEYTLFVPYSSYEADLILAPRYDVKVAPLHGREWLPVLALVRRFTRCLFGQVSLNGTIHALERADIIIDIRGIVFSDKLGSNTPWSKIGEGWLTLLGKILRKPLVKYTSSMGPFDQKWNRIFTKFYFGHFVDLILVRDEVSYRQLRELRIRTPVLRVPDTAFLLPAHESTESQRYATLRRQGPLVGLSVSFQALNRVPRSVSYVSIMEDFAQYLIEKYNAHVVLIPNDQSQKLNNDLAIAEEICARVSNIRCDVLHTENLLAQDIKGVIAQCEVVVAARYHTVVAALSLGIPTLAISWHHKYVGVLELFKQKDWVCEIEQLSLENLVQKFEALWYNRDGIRKTVTACLPDVRAQIAMGAGKVYEVVCAKSNRQGKNWHPSKTTKRGDPTKLCGVQERPCLLPGAKQYLGEH